VVQAVVVAGGLKLLLVVLVHLDKDLRVVMLHIVEHKQEQVVAVLMQ
jgi:hypothetical protein